jgi:hypothetical protein
LASGSASLAFSAGSPALYLKDECRMGKPG